MQTTGKAWRMMTEVSANPCPHHTHRYRGRNIAFPKALRRICRADVFCWTGGEFTLHCLVPVTEDCR